MTLASALIAIGWSPEIRGILIVIIAVGTLCGSVYLLLATNLGARLGFLVALAGLFGWLMLMGIVWAIYGIGLKGPEPSWDAIPGRTVLQDTNALYQAGVFDTPVDVPEGTSFTDAAELVKDEFVLEGWTPLAEDEPGFGQASAAAGTFLEETGAFAAGEFKAVNVFDIGGERFPKIGPFDFLAFWHEPHYAVVEVAPLVPTRTEPGRAPAAAEIDTSRQHQYVYMVRNLGARRQPAFVLAIFGGIIFLVLCWLLHRRDQVLVQNRSATRSWRSDRAMSQYLPIVVLMILSVLFGIISFAMSRLLAPRRPSAAKEAPYECGIVPSREPPERFPVSFYVVAMLFVMFDIEIIFVYPYAVAHSGARHVRVRGDPRSSRCCSS